MPTVHLIGHDAEALTHDPALEVRGEEAVVTTQQEPSRNLGPRVERPRLLEGRARLVPHGTGQKLGRHLRRNVVQELGFDVEFAIGRTTLRDGEVPMGLLKSGIGPPIARSLTGRGTMAATRTINSTGMRSHTNGAVKPAIDWATRTTSDRSPIASTTTSAYSARPAESSSHGRSAATTA